MLVPDSRDRETREPSHEGEGSTPNRYNGQQDYDQRPSIAITEESKVLAAQRELDTYSRHDVSSVGDVEP
jgi:hypothetical protein